MRFSLSHLKLLAVNRYTFFLLFLLVYTWIAELYGCLPALLPAWRLETPLLLYIYFYFNQITRKSRFQFLIAAIPILLLYAISDVYFLQLGRLLRINEVSELPELFHIIPNGIKILIILVCGLPLLAFFLSLQWRRIRVLALGGVPLLALGLAVAFIPDPFMRGFEKTQQEIVFYSDAKSAYNNGRISMMLYNQARQNSSYEKTAAYRDKPPQLMEYSKVVHTISDQRTKRNVHLIVLESFMDPTLFQNARFSQNPVHPDFEKLFKDKGGYSVSPVFGGATAQAEFEVLCGVPAMRELSGIEFNVFTGAKTLCLPNILSQAGYQTVATNAFVPDFFNSVNAYEGLGFEQTYYPSEYAPVGETYLVSNQMAEDAAKEEDKREKYMFDGDLLAQNLAFVARRIKENPDAPIFNYIMSIYGHTPHQIDTDQRPKIIKVLGDYQDDHFEKSVNQYYYRTEAIAAYVKGLLKVDPKSLIILMSDHLPPLQRGPGTYDNFNYLGKQEGYLHTNRIYFIENGRSVQYNTIHHYDVPQIILNYAMQGKIKRDRSGKFATHKGLFDLNTYREAYFSIMAQAMNVKTLAAPPAKAACPPDQSL
ncbi:MAG: sulfatase-like hydrolase/transferase [Deltaproteobacteria bacterium]|nr:sulfatase-like hydrolase/transferase [Deltaproteobacteria bacterium]